ncbi:MAG: hypothetical protein ABIJ15_07185 [bacterium]
MDKISIEGLKRKTSDCTGNPFEILKRSFDGFNKRWVKSQKAGPLDKKEIDTLIIEALDEEIGEKKKKT